MAIASKTVAAEVLAIQALEQVYRPSEWAMLDDQLFLDQIELLESGDSLRFRSGTSPDSYTFGRGFETRGLDGLFVFKIEVEAQSANQLIRIENLARGRTQHAWRASSVRSR